MIKRLYCPRCGKLVGAEDTSTGEHEYVNAARWWKDSLYCRECYNMRVLNNTEFMGGAYDEALL